MLSIRYVHRGYENRVIESLKDCGLSVVVGLPGIGKTRIVEFCSSKLSDEMDAPIVWISFKDFDHVKLIYDGKEKILPKEWIGEC